MLATMAPTKSPFCRTATDALAMLSRAETVLATVTLSNGPNTKVIVNLSISEAYVMLHNFDPDAELECFMGADEKTLYLGY